MIVSSEVFNLIEGFFWSFLGLLALICYFRADAHYKKICIFSAIVLTTFGVSDFVQVLYGSFFQPGMQWLYLWKIVDVVGLLSIVVWYFILRLKSK